MCYYDKYFAIMLVLQSMFIQIAISFDANFNQCCCKCQSISMQISINVDANYSHKFQSMFIQISASVDGNV